MIKVHFISLGCPKNLVDSEKILGSLGSCGIGITPLPKESDTIVINTCGFIKPAIEETQSVIERVIKKYKNKSIYVYGCAVNRMKDLLKRRFPEVNNWFKLNEREGLIKEIAKRFFFPSARLVTTKGFAYLKIADGCSNHCSYCTIPQIKGEYKSVELDELLAETKELVKLNVKELILIAQDTTRYGVDIYQRPMLAPLLKEISKLKGVFWIRIMYAHPKTIDDNLIREIRENPKICKYLDMPIQHINERILNLMNRKYNRKKVEKIIAELKKIKDLTLRTTVIAGFPTETEDEFNELCDFLKSGYFDYLGVFPYCQEADTKAFNYPQLPEEIITKRYQKLLRIQREQLRKKNLKMVGKSYRCLIHKENGAHVGHTQFQAPEIDGQVIIISDSKLRLGNFYKCKIKKIKGTDLYATLS